MPISRGSTTWFDKELHNRSTSYKRRRRGGRRAAGGLKQERETYERRPGGGLRLLRDIVYRPSNVLHAVDDSDCRLCQRQPDCSDNVDGPQGPIDRLAVERRQASNDLFSMTSSTGLLCTGSCSNVQF
jgi:hypothetical protein